jgi:hypothetical protein
MKRLSHSSPSPLNPEDQQAPSWLVEQVYTPKRQRTIALVKQSVEILKQESQRISLASIAAKSKEVDPDHIGVSESAILSNEEARGFYELHRSWKQARRALVRPTEPPAHPRIGSIKLDRDEERTRLRYLRLSKQDLVQRLLALERAYAEDKEQWLEHNDELLNWRLRAEAAEARLQRKAAAASEVSQGL